jgi:hypothetical protein
MASARGDGKGLRSVRAGSLKEGERIALAISAAAARYRSLSRTGKQRLLDELQPQHRRRYGPEVVAALVPLWEASDRLCGKRLQALLPLLVESLEHPRPPELEPSVRESCWR